MDNNAYSGTETELSGYQSNANQELDFVDHWINWTVEEEVLRGCKLREEKCKSFVPRQKECRLVDINSTKSPYSDDRREKLKKRCRTSPYSRSPQVYCSPPRSPSIKSRRIPRCPLRIAELAAPSKRLCIENWRSRCDVLPPPMVERLKLQVMNEGPTVPIMDAVTCFKRGRKKPAKSTGRKPKKSERDSFMTSEQMAELRRLCAIFGKKIAQRLITPQNLKLNPELNKISKIVADEVANMIKSGKFKKNNINDQMQAEISEKIAVWISTVLEDTSYKLLEEDLRELEEEEGPVLDFIDDVIDKVMDICIPQENSLMEDFSEKTSHASGEDRDSLENNEFETSTPHTSVIYETGDNISIDKNDDTRLTVGEIQNEIDKIIDSVVGVDSDEEAPNIELVDKRNFSNLMVTKDNFNDTNEVEEKIDNDTNELPTENNKSEILNDSEVLPLEDFNVDSENLNLESGLNPTDDLEGLKPENNVSEVFGIFAEEYHDDKDKKVIFSDIDLGPGGRHKQLDEKGIALLHDDDTNKPEAAISNTSTNTELRNIVFAPPNTNLLSDADELWPKSIKSGVKVTTSASKSVISLGNITEKEEKLSVIVPENEVQKELKGVLDEKGEIHDLNHKVNPIQQIHGNEGKLQDISLKQIDNVIGSSKVNPTQQTHENEAKLQDITIVRIDVIRNSKDKVYPTQKIHGNEEKLQDITIYRIDNVNRSSIDKVYPTQQIHGNEGKLQDITIDRIDNVNRSSIDKVYPTQQIHGNEGKLQDITMDRIDNVMGSSTDELPDKNGIIIQTGQQEPFLRKGRDLIQQGTGGDESSNVIYQTGEQKNQADALSEPKFDYKVNPNTAPSWLRRDYGKGEPSEDLIDCRCKTKGKSKEDEIRIWCKNLERMFANVDLWNRWLKTTCKNIYFLKQKRAGDFSEMNKAFATHTKRNNARQWIMLKNDFDKDAILWAKLYKRANKKFNAYKARILSSEYDM